jgi:hypothetical protein
MEGTSQFNGNQRAKQLPKDARLQEVQDPLAKVRACKSYQVDVQEASDRLRRANRDLGELAAFIAASLTTVTAVEAVINIAVDKIGLARQTLHVAFDGYIGLLAAILFLGILRFTIIMHRRARAERKLDQAKKGVYTFCPTEQWLKPEE